jgi:beta-N-acetylhexosaminidase
MRRRRVVLAACAAFAAGLTTAVARGETQDVTAAAPVAGGLTPGQLAAADLGVRELAGQRVVVGFPGTSVPDWLRDAIERGDVGGVILFSANVVDSDQVRKLTKKLQKIERPVAAPLLVMVDQEGGLVKRLPGPPDASAEELGEAGVKATARAGEATGRNLEGMGVNVDLAPVADVARPGSNLDDDGCAFGTNASKVAERATAFAEGIEQSRVAATAKHFPGFGAAPVNTDFEAVTIDASKRKLRRVDGLPFRATTEAGVDLVMVNTIIYTAFDPGTPAAFSRKIVTGELRGRYDYDGVTVTDALGTPAAAPFGDSGRLAVLSAQAGMDVMLYTDKAGLAGSKALAAKLRKGKLDRGEFERSVGRILDLRGRLVG